MPRSTIAHRAASGAGMPAWRRPAILVVVTVLVGMIASCGDGSTEPADDASPRYLATVPPLAMVVRPVLAGRGKVETLLNPGDSPHTYAPVPSDVRAASEADAIFYGSEHLDGWAADLPGDRQIGLVGLLPDSVRRTFGEGEPHGGTVDPHFWTDPRAVMGLLPALVDTLCALDRAGCATYRTNADSFAVALNALDHELAKMMAPVQNEPVVLAQPFFEYFLARYGPRLVGTVEPSPAKEPSPRHVQATVETIQTSEARAVLTQRQLSDRSARAVVDAADVPLVVLDPIGGVAGRTRYEELLRWNARTVRQALRGNGL